MIKNLLGIVVLVLLWSNITIIYSAAEVLDYDCSNAPHGSVNPGTCWGDSAYQCDSGRPRQDFYDKIQSLSSAGTSGENGTPYNDGGKEAYDLYKKLCKIKQKEKPKKNQDEILLKEQPKWLLDLFPFSMTQ